MKQMPGRRKSKKAGTPVHMEALFGRIWSLEPLVPSQNEKLVEKNGQKIFFSLFSDAIVIPI